MSELIGYARVSTQEQELNLQLDAFQKAGYEKARILVGKILGAKDTTVESCVFTKKALLLDHCLFKS